MWSLQESLIYLKTTGHDQCLLKAAHRSTLSYPQVQEGCIWALLQGGTREPVFPSEADGKVWAGGRQDRARPVPPLCRPWLLIKPYRSRKDGRCKLTIKSVQLPMTRT